MQMDAGLDTGAMLLVERLPIAPADTTGSLHDKLAELGGAMIFAALELVAAGRAQPVPQPDLGVTYAHKIDKAEAPVDWRLDAAVIERRIRAFDPFPGASTVVEGEAVKLWRAEIAPASGQAGAVLAADATGVVVACGAGALRLTELQRPGGKRLDAADFLRGFPLTAGARLGQAA